MLKKIVIAMLAVSYVSTLAIADEEYMLLESQFGELCTMCEAIVICREEPFEDAASQIADLNTLTGQDFVLYHFKTKTFWGQIATIWDYFALWIEPVTAEKRPVMVYQFDADTDGQDTFLRETAFLSRDEARIDIGHHRIDRVEQVWSEIDGDDVGYCLRADLRKALPQIPEIALWRDLADGDLVAN